MQRDLRSSFSEIECKLNSIATSSADNVEEMQNQLHEAKVSLTFLNSASVDDIDVKTSENNLKRFKTSKNVEKSKRKRSKT